MDNADTRDKANSCITEAVTALSVTNRCRVVPEALNDPTLALL